MAGIGIKLNKIFNKHMVTSSIYGIGYSFVFTIAPMIVVIGCLLLMFAVLGFDEVGYLERELFSASILYIFIFSFLISSILNSVLSKYMTDKIYKKRYQDIRPCIYVGTIINLTSSSLVAIPFYLYKIIVGQVAIYYVFTTYMLFLGLSLTFSSMVYNSILKQYKNISLFFICSMVLTFILSVIFRFILKFSVTYSMLLALVVGFLLIASLEIANVWRFFPSNSYKYKDVLDYFKIYWKLIVANFLYTLGLFAHNFVYWAETWHIEVANTYVYNQPYDMASCLAMFTNISASILFISRVEMHFHDLYKEYVEAVIGDKLDSIEKNKKRLLRGLSAQLLDLTHLQFIISIVVYLMAIITLPIIGFSGMTMEIYPQLAVGYFISFLMYSEMLFLYYFDDLTGALLNSVIFITVTLAGSLVAKELPVIWYGLGFTTGSLCAFTFSYFRLRWIGKNMDNYIFCKGVILKQVYEDAPDSLVYSRYETKI